jgi:transposase
MKELADEELKQLSAVFNRMYSQVGRPSIAPGRIMKSLLMALYYVRSERLFSGQVGYNLLFRWFLDMDLEEGSFDATVFSRNRERLLKY